MKQTLYSRKSSWIVGLLILPLLFFASQVSSAHRQAHGSSASREPINVGMVALVAVPERYHGKFIRTHGFLSIEFEGDALYLHEEDYRHALTKNSMSLRLSKSQREQFKKLSLKYVLIEGTVDAMGLESTDAWRGAIGNITRLEAWRFDNGPVPHQ